MPLENGHSLSHYQILAPLGRGGMGEVYRALDTKLGREVAIKVLPAELAANDDRLRRFEREAKTLASLNHPNVAGIHGVDQEGDVCFLALELVPGEDLATRLERGALSVSEAIDVCRQIAEGLEAAHEAGVVHRDLKPANVRLTDEGVVKILDFGLAKPIHSRSTGEGTSNGESDSFLMTEEGRVLGTPTYMSPEQARGKPVDRRTDIWAFGCVLYECLTGRRAFVGETFGDLIAAILEHEVDLDLLPAGTPGHVRRLIQRTLTREARTRLRDIGEARFVLESGEALPEDMVAPRTRPWGWVAALLVTAALVYCFAPRNEPEPSAPDSAVHFELRAASDAVVWAATIGVPSAPAISPDGAHVVFAVYELKAKRPSLWLRSLATPAARPLPETIRAYQPFWSPDSEFIAFAVQDHLHRLHLASGRVDTICKLPEGPSHDASGFRFVGATWSESDVIVFSVGSGLYSVAAEGGRPRPLTELDAALGETGHSWPHLLAGGGLLFVVGSAREEVRGLYVASLDAPGERKRLMPESVRAVFASGRLLFALEDTLYAQSFDVERRALIGDPVALVAPIACHAGLIPWGRFNASANGHLVFLAPPESDVQLSWVDRQGLPIELLGAPGAYGQISLSPDEREIAVSVEGSEGSDLWVMNVSSGRTVRVTSDPGDEEFAVWSPDGNELVFAATRDLHSPTTIRRKRLHVDEPSVPLLELDKDAVPQQWTKDGNLLYVLANAALWQRPVAGEGSGSRLLGATVVVEEPRFSRDGRWLAYLVNESDLPGLMGDWQVHVAPAGRPGDRVRASSLGGFQPRWRADGQELFYMRKDGFLMSITVNEVDGRPSVGEPVELFGLSFPRPSKKDWQVRGDGQSFLVKRLAEGGTPDTLHVILNWTELVSRTSSR